MCIFAPEFSNHQTLIIMANSKNSNEKAPWWVIVLKVCAYALGLILAGYGTTACAASLSKMVGIF